MGNNLIWPGKNDTSINGGVSGAAKTVTEPSSVALFTAMANLDFVVSGFACSYSTLNVTVATGEAVIGGRRCVRSGASFSSVALSASSTNYIWLQATLDGNSQATGLSVIKTTSSTPPSGGPSLLLATATTDGSGVTASTDQRTYNRDPWLEPIAWASLQVTGSSISILRSQGVASVSRSAAGTYSLTLDRPIVGDTNVCGLATPWSMGSTALYLAEIQRTAATTCSFIVYNSGGTAADKDGIWSVAIFAKRTYNY